LLFRTWFPYFTGADAAKQSCRATVETKKDEWIEVKVPLDNFEPVSFGRLGKDAGAVKPEEINALGFTVRKMP